MDLSDPLVVAILVAGFYMAWNIGANDLANSMGDVVGSRSLTLAQVIPLAGALNLLGAIFFGSRVTLTVGKGIVPIEGIGPHLVTVGALAILLGAGLWITLATYFNVPVSTTHAIVGAVLGFGLVSASGRIIGLGEIRWLVLFKVVLSWLLSPLSGALMAFLLYCLIRSSLIDRVGDLGRLERVFRYFVIVSSGYQAFSHGSNDVANAIAPVAMALGSGGELPRWVLIFGGLGIAIGLATWGYRVVWTIGQRITELTPTRAFSADIAAASTVFICSRLGLPVSTTHTLVGATIGIGLARGMEALNLQMVRDIVISWFLTVPVAAAVAALLYFIFLILGL
jgi:PiT family inorganic phosphate transporter